jgi:hypothetical protein
MKEAEMNYFLLNDEKLVKGLECVPFNKNTTPITIEGMLLSEYSYIKLPFY